MKLDAKLILVFFVGELGIVALFSSQMIRCQQNWERLCQENHATELVDALTPEIAKAYRDGAVVTSQEAVEVLPHHVRGSKQHWVDKQSGTVAPDSKTTVLRVSSLSISKNDGFSIDATYIPLVIGAVNPEQSRSRNPRTIKTIRLISRSSHRWFRC